MGGPRVRLCSALRGWAACAVGLAWADDTLSAEILEDFSRLWDLVVVERASRNVPMEGVPDVRRVCQYGLGSTTLSPTRFLLREARPAVDTLELHDVETPSMQELLPPLRAEFGGRLEFPPAEDLAALGDPGALAPAVAVTDRPACDLAVISQNSTAFTLERLLHRVAGARYLAVAWISVGCMDANGNTTGAHCGFLNMFWDKTLLMRRGYCFRHVCMSRVPVDRLHDPNIFSLDCQGFVGARGAAAVRNWSSPAAEFSQDWYVVWNFFASLAGPESEEGGAPTSPARGGVYVDVGAALPFEYSNTVALDRCLGWRGLCIEPNGGILPWLRNYRSCDVVHNCVTEQSDGNHTFRDRNGAYAFSASCRSLGDILKGAGLQGQRIDVLFIDVENGELGVLRGIRLRDFDIAVMVVEVGHGARWLEVETEVLQHGYAKVAVLGRDVVYARLDLLRGRLGEEATWTRFPGSFLPGFAADDSLERPLAAAKAHCEGLGERCSGVTCSADEDACSVRAGRTAYVSPSAEVSHAKKAGDGAVPPFLASHRALLPEGWREFHQRVVDEELELEGARERQLALRGLRRLPVAGV